MLIALLGFTAAAALIVLIPGPDTLVVLRALLRNGPRQARRTVLGVLTGLTIWASCAVLGISALLRASHTGYTVLRVVGAVYLCIIGIQAFRSRGVSAEIDRHGSRSDAAEPGDTAAALVAETAPERTRRGGVLGTGYVAGITTDLLNPKVGVFFVTFLPAFVPHGQPVGPITLLFGAIFVVETGLYFLILLRFADRLMGAMRRPRTRRILDRSTGLVLFGFGVRLALE